MAKPTQPGRDASGPGSEQYDHGVQLTSVRPWWGFRYRLYVPVQPGLPTAPTFIMVPGAAENPESYERFLTHVCRHGYNVVAIDHGNAFSSWTLTLAKNSVNHALKTLVSSGQGSLAKLAVGGHSIGGLIAYLLAMKSDVRAILQYDPTSTGEKDFAWQRDDFDPFTSWIVRQISNKTLTPLAIDSFATISSDAYVTYVVGQSSLDYTFDGGHHKKKYDWFADINNITQVHRSRKNFLCVAKDDHGEPPVEGLHSFFTSKELTVTDNIMWRATVATLDHVFSAVNYEYVSEAGSKVKDAGKWSDGLSVRQVKTGEELGL